MFGPVCVCVFHLNQCSSSGKVRAADDFTSIQVVIGMSCQVKDNTFVYKNKNEKGANVVNALHFIPNTVCLKRYLPIQEKGKGESVVYGHT